MIRRSLERTLSELSEFVLSLYESQGAIVEAPRYGIYEALLPDDLAARLDIPALQRIVFDEPGPPEEDGKLYLTRGHPLIDRLVELVRQSPAPTQVYINNVRLDKRGLLALARRALTLSNARLVEAERQVEAAALFHYVRFTFKVTLTTDEKREQLVSVTLDAQNGWRVDWAAIEAEATLEDAPAFAHLLPASPIWIAEQDPLSLPALQGLLERARCAVIEELAPVIEAVQRRAARYLELDRARLEQYYDELAHDLERRLQRAESDRRATLQEKRAAIQTERQAKLADAETRYRLRIDLELVTAEVIVQPKLALEVKIETRGTAIRRRVVWDPLLHRMEPLRCDVCGRPGVTLHLCSGGHLAHGECLLEQQCVECKREYCRLCGEQMGACAVCGRPVCLRSLVRCPQCGRGTCATHRGLCHAAGGQPAMPAGPVAEAEIPPAPKPVARPAPKAPPPAKRPASAARPPAEPVRPAVRADRMVVEVESDVPEVRAFVLSGKKRGPAVRTWRLTPRGIAIECRCEKGERCAADKMLVRPRAAAAIDAQVADLLDDLRQEYGVPARAVTIMAQTHTGMRQQPRLVLPSLWKDEEALEEARTLFDVVYAERHRTEAPHPPAPPRPKPAAPALPPLTPDEEAEARTMLEAARGLLRLEGVLRFRDLYGLLQRLVQPGPWCTADYLLALLKTNTAFFKVQSNNWVADIGVSNVQTIARRKAQYARPPRTYNLQELLAAGADDAPLSEREKRIQVELSRMVLFGALRVRTLEDAIRNAETPEQALGNLARQSFLWQGLRIRALPLIEELWPHTTRYELHGRTPAEDEALGAA